MHRAAYISWDKLHRNIRVELAKTPTNAATQTIYKIVQTGIRPAHRDKSYIAPCIIYLFFEYSLAKREHPAKTV
jgi:hypothetical protein